MATIVLSAAGMALGGSVGGSVLGLSAATIGRAAGAVIGRRIDQQILGGGSEPVETGQVDRFRVTGATEGADVQQIYGRMRVPGQVIWASQFLESSSTSSSGGGKGGGQSSVSTTTYSYSVSIAVALCEGQISRVGRIWADGDEISPQRLNMRVYSGDVDQLPDPKISAVEGSDYAPAYRGTAYVVLEDLALESFGNRIPQLTFEIMRDASAAQPTLAQRINGVALAPGTGEYTLATSQLHLSSGGGSLVAVNTNSPLGQSDFSVSMDALQGELPGCGSVVLTVSWFGDDLRCGSCDIKPKVSQSTADAVAMPWRVSGTTRAAAALVPQVDDTPIYAGTPADDAVVEAIVDLLDRGLETVFFPTLLMDQVTDNTLPDPWSGEDTQQAQPWRGRITTSLAPGVAGSPDETAAAATEVAAFMGNAAVSDFTISGRQVSYVGAADWGYRRFILHYAHLCAAAGGVSAFCIGSDMRGLTQVRAADGSFPFVDALIDLAANVRGILGADCQISYAADWTEYHGFQPAGTDDKIFHLDQLWADGNIDFIGVEAYMPLSDWRDGEDHSDADVGRIYDMDYLQGNVAGGEAFDWVYPTPEARAAQRRVVITDPDGEPWVWRAKDFAGWWANAHHDRIDGMRQTMPTDWVPKSKPIWFTQFGCPAIDKGANQPALFLDPAASSGDVPYYSNGSRDDVMQMQYLLAVTGHFADDANNPASDVYDGRMVDTNRMHAWGWDARPYPFWPGNRTLWPDGEAYAGGHWINGRATNQSLAAVVAEICERSGVFSYDVSALFGVVRGFNLADIDTGRAALQPLMLAYGFDAMESDGVLVFRNRDGLSRHSVTDDTLGVNPESDETLSLIRSAATEVTGRVQFSYLHADGDYEAVASEAVHHDEVSFAITRSDAPVVLTRSEGQNTVNRWLQEARVGRDTVKFALPPSQSQVGVGDVVALSTAAHSGNYRIDRIEDSGLRLVEATRVDAEIYRPQLLLDEGTVLQPYSGPTPAEILFMDLPLLTGDETPHAPYIAAYGQPWPGSIALYSAAQDSDYVLQEIIPEAATVGETKTGLERGPVGIWDRQAGLEVSLFNGALSSATQEALLAGANTIVIGNGSVDQWEVFQFQTATPIYDGGYLLSGLLRGQAGSHGIMPDLWYAGAKVALMNGVPDQLTLPTSTRGNERHFRFGPAQEPITDTSYRYVTHTFAGNGLRPYPVVHLKAQLVGGDLTMSWIRCSRIDGDIWADDEIPLGENSEVYKVRVTQGGSVRRELTVSAQNWTYSAAERAEDVGTSDYQVEVAQVSDRYGVGPYTTLTVEQ